MTDNTPQFVKDLRTAAPAYFEELQKLAPTAVIDLFELRLTQAVNNVDETLYYHSSLLLDRFFLLSLSLEFYPQ